MFRRLDAIFDKKKTQETTENVSELKYAIDSGVAVRKSSVLPEYSVTTQTALLNMAISRNLFGQTNSQQETADHVVSESPCLPPPNPDYMLVLDTAERLRHLLATDPAFKSPNLLSAIRGLNKGCLANFVELRDGPIMLSGTTVKDNVLEDEWRCLEGAL
ncbi:hypothetical protein AAG570_013905 [Ranatra chinensis]|uniref:Uncharacterized protein n=1 Tax=Ranatra chinensis TaxID=642074 RepID=A0ABD0YDH9_9HEMI